MRTLPYSVMASFPNVATDSFDRDVMTKVERQIFGKAKFVWGPSALVLEVSRPQRGTVRKRRGQTMLAGTE